MLNNHLANLKKQLEEVRNESFKQGIWQGISQRNKEISEEIEKVRLKWITNAEMSVAEMFEELKSSLKLNGQQIDVEGKLMIPPTQKASSNATSVTADTNNHKSLGLKDETK